MPINIEYPEIHIIHYYIITLLYNNVDTFLNSEHEFGHALGLT